MWSSRAVPASPVAVIVATDPLTAGRLVPSLPQVTMRSMTTFYHAAPSSPIGQALLLVDADDALVLNTVVLSDAAPSYAPAGTALISSSVLGVSDDPAVEPAVRRRLGELYGTDTSRWEHLATVPLPAAVPAMLPPLDLRPPIRVDPGIYVCGDHRATASVEGAMSSGRRAAEAVLTRLGRTAKRR